MSLILDALRKSDMERSRHKAPDVAAGGGGAAPRGGQRWLLPVIALLAINLAFLVFLLFRPATPAATQDDASNVTATPAAALPAAPIAATPPAVKADVRSLLGETIREAAADRRNAPPVSAAQRTAGADVAAPPGGTAASDAVRDTLPSFSELSASGELTLAPLNLELHVYSERPASRFAFINGQKVAEGDRLNGGGRVTEITRFGVILEHNGRRFALDRD